MQSHLDRDTEAGLAERLIRARRAVRAADRAPHDVAAIRQAQSGMAGVLADALAAIEATAGSVTEDNLEAVGFTGEEVRRYLAEAKQRAAQASTRQIRRAA